MRVIGQRLGVCLVQASEWLALDCIPANMIYPGLLGFGHGNLMYYSRLQNRLPLRLSQSSFRPLADIT
jgi:hypothetical protein